MMLRKLLVRGFYYYLVISLTGAFCIFVSVFNTVLNQFGYPRMGHEYDEDEQTAKIFWAGFLIYLLVALFINIIFIRKQSNMSSLVFALCTIGFFIVFILPSLFMLIGFMLSAKDIY